MLMLHGESVFLRALEPEDLDYLFNLENNSEFWEISTTLTPFSKHILKIYLQHTHRDIYEVKQLRLVICRKEDQAPLGLIDLFDFEPHHRRTAIGILIENNQERGKGYGGEAIAILCRYCFQQLNLHQIYANVGGENTASQKLFEKAGFQKIGVKKDWNFVNGKYKDEIVYQKFEDVY